MNGKFKSILLGTIVASTFFGTTALAANGTMLKVYYNVKNILINGESIMPQEENLKPFTYKDRTFVPLDFIGEKLGKNVDWDDQNDTVVIKDQDGNEELIPVDVFKQFQAKFTVPELVKIDQVKMVKLKMRGALPTQFGLYTNLDHLNGGFVLYELEDGTYEEVYSINEPVYGIEDLGDLLTVTSGFGGTGIQNNTIHVVKYIEDEGYLDVWTGASLNLNFGGPLPYSQENGSISLDMQNKELVYSKTVRTYEDYDIFEDDNAKPEKIDYITEIYRYNDETNQFEFVE